MSENKIKKKSIFIIIIYIVNFYNKFIRKMILLFIL